MSSDHDEMPQAVNDAREILHAVVSHPEAARGFSEQSTLISVAAHLYAARLIASRLDAIIDRLWELGEWRPE